jgi:glutaredoxin
LNNRGYEFSEIDIEAAGMNRDDLQAKTGGRTVPQIVINGKPVGGYQDLVLLDSTGKLKDLVAD